MKPVIEHDKETENDMPRITNEIEYVPHSMLHKATVRMDPTKLEMLDGFECVDAGHKFTPQNSDVRVMIIGRDWSEKCVLIYGSKSSNEPYQYIETIIDRVSEIGHNIEVIDGPTISNIAVNGNLGGPFRLEELTTDLITEGVDVEYEPEQFPAMMVKLDSPSVTFLLFSTGKSIIQGLRTTANIEPAIEEARFLLGD